MTVDSRSEADIDDIKIFVVVQGFMYRLTATNTKRFPSKQIMCNQMYKTVLFVCNLNKVDTSFLGYKFPFLTRIYSCKLQYIQPDIVSCTFSLH